MKKLIRGYVWDPAGSDRELSLACVDANLGRTEAVRRVLAGCRDRPWLREARSLVLALSLADSDLSEQMLALDPHDPDTLLLYARTMTVRALRLEARGHGGDARLLAQRAGEACAEAAQSSPQDATPWVALLSLAPLGLLPAVPDPYGLDVRGPWAVWQEIRERNALSREGHRRLLAAVSERYGGSHSDMWTVTHWVASSCSPDSDPQLLVLAAYAERYRAWRHQPLADRQWAEQDALLAAVRIHEHWFARVKLLTAPLVPVADLSLLAHALLAGGPKLVPEAGQVLRAMLPYAVRQPWDLFGDPTEQLDQALVRVGIRPPP